MMKSCYSSLALYMRPRKHDLIQEKCEMPCLLFTTLYAQGLSFQAKARGVPVQTGDRVWWSPACVKKGGRVLVHLYPMSAPGFPFLFAYAWVGHGEKQE